MLRKLVAALTAVAAAATGVGVPTFAAHQAPAAVFRVGGAVRSIDPPVPVYAGGFGASPAIRHVTGQLQVRAFYVARGRSAVAFAVVDSQAWFAAYQEGDGYGISDARAVAARQLSRLGVSVTSADIIVQGTHSHSAATLEGIWGPVPLRYLKLVHDQTVAAIVAAARAARPAVLQFATIDAPFLDNIQTAQYDSFPGWTQDGQLSVLRAVSPTTGASIASFVNVPAHPDIVCGACVKTLTADYFGAVREALDRRLGGVNVVSPATLGREESPVQATGIDEMRWYAGIVTSLAEHALTHATPIRDATIRGHESMVYIPGTNAALLALNSAWKLPDSAKQQLLDASGEYPIDRSMSPPYLVGTAIGTPLTTVRIGPLAFVSMPGEPFPEIRLDLAKAVTGVRAVIGLSKGQDDLGYYYPSWVTPFAYAYPTDQGTFNVAPQAGDEIMQGQLANVAAVGFGTQPVAVPSPLPADYAATLRPAVQALASPTYAVAGSGGRARVVLQAIYAPANENGAPLAGKVHWSFGDGTTATSPAKSFGGYCGYVPAAQIDNGPTTCPSTNPAYVVHDFGVGVRRVVVRATDTQGNTVTYAFTVTVLPAPRPHVVVVHRSGRTVTFAVGLQRGLTLLAASWRFGDGATARGLVVTHTFAPGSPATATPSVTAA